MNSAYLKIKKYLFLLSFFAIFLLCFHLVYLYVYTGAERVPQKWGVVSIGLVGSVPTLHPLDVGGEGMNDLVFPLLYRSISSYNPDTHQIEGDLAFCDISRLKKISCSFNEGGLWSDGSFVTRDDVIATYDFYKKHATNPAILGLLGDLTLIEKGASGLEFSFTKESTESLRLLLLPILQKAQLETFSAETGSFATAAFSGPYVFAEIGGDQDKRAHTITLTRNTAYAEKDIYVDEYTLFAFDTEEDLIAVHDDLDVIYSATPIQGINSVQFKEYDLFQTRYISLFLNAENISLHMRNILLQIQRETISEEINGEVQKMKEGDIFFWPIATPEMDVSQALYDAGYKTKSQLLDALDTDDSKEPEVRVAKVDDIKNSNYVTAPELKKVMFVTDADFLLSGNPPENTNTVSINSYTLQGYKKWNELFHYRLRPSYSNISLGKNEYNIVFQDDNGDTIGEERVVIFYQPIIDNDKKIALLQEIKNDADLLHNTAPKVTVFSQEEKRLQIKKLSDTYIYDASLSPLSFSLQYLKTSDRLVWFADKIQESFIKYGIDIEHEPISFDDIQGYVSTGGKKYDLILAGVNLGIFENNFFPYFHSGQSEHGYNFSKIRNLDLDVQLEKLRFNVLVGDELTKTYNTIRDLLTKEAVVDTLFHPEFFFWVDKSLYNFTIPDDLSSPIYIGDLLQGANIEEAFQLDTEDKGVFGFFSWLFGNIF